MAFRDEWGVLHLDPVVVQRLLDKVEFNDPEDAFPITGRGIAFSSSRWFLPEGIWEPWDLSSRTLNFEGHRLKCMGCEAFAILRSPESPYRHPLALMFKPEDLEAVGYDYRRFDRTQE
jgi:hypothetical protein